MKYRILLAVAAFAALPSHAAVSVTFANPESYTDVANERHETQSTLDALERHIHKLGQRYVTRGENLRIEILDIDLAGWPRWSGRSPNEVRTLHGRADFPVIKLRYTLEANGTSQTREAVLSDLLYLDRGVRTRSNEAFHYEKRLLEDWFRSVFAQRAR